MDDLDEMAAKLLTPAGCRPENSGMKFLSRSDNSEFG
jgi:hypothetical protein